MDSKKALERLVWRFSTGKAFTPNQNDKEALNAIILLYNNSTTNISQSQEPFAILYIYLINAFMTSYDCMPNNEIIQNKINELLSFGLRYHIEELQKTINSKIVDNVFNKDVKSDKIGYQMNENEKKETLEQIKNINEMDIIEKQVDYNYVSENIIQQVNKQLDKWK